MGSTVDAWHVFPRIPFEEKPGVLRMYRGHNSRTVKFTYTAGTVSLSFHELKSWGTDYIAVTKLMYA
jgi:hypothetical protein